MDDEPRYTYAVRVAPARPRRGPEATYALLSILVAVFFLEEALLLFGQEDLVGFVFLIAPGWWLHPWSLITSTVSHGSLSHLFFNGLFLYFLGPTAEHVLGQRRYLTFFFATGAASGIAQVTLKSGAALGASGALMGLFGIALILIPTSKIIMFPLPIPLPLWVAGIFFVLADLLGVFTPDSGIGNVAHLAGLGLGLLYGFHVKRLLARRGLIVATR